MANNQSYPQSIYPIAGDVQSTVGNQTVTVTGIQGVPFSPTAPTPGQVPVFISGVWTPSSTANSQANQSIQVNGIAYSDDYWVFINRKDTEVQVNSAFSPNGFPILAAGTPVNTP